MSSLTQLRSPLPVAEVTLLEDRAMVVRRGALDLPSGRSRLVVEGVAPVLVDKTLAALLVSAGEGQAAELRVLSVMVSRRMVTRSAEQPQSFAELEQARRTKLAELEAKRAELQRSEQGGAGIEQITKLSLAELAEDVSWGRSEPAVWTRALDSLDAKRRELAEEQCRLRHAIRELERELADIARHSQATKTLASEAAAELRIDLLNPGEACQASLRVDYLVPGALWRPWHTARLIEASGDQGARVEFRCEAAVWQATGEDWSEAQLNFSTERPSLGVEPPKLQTDQLRLRKRSSTVEVEVREEKVNTAGLGAGGLEGSTGPAKSVAKDELPGIDDGGEALELRGMSKASVPADGRPHRVPIFSFEAPAETALVCAPELVEAVMLRSRQQNRSEHPLLAGPVDLVRDRGLVGRSSILYIAPGERFELGWGPDSSLRVHREVESLDSERRMMSSWTRKPKRVSLKLSNLGAAPKTLEIKERVPVSEIDKVEVEVRRLSKGQEPDADGFVTWELKLPGFGHDELSLEWALVVLDDVVGV